MAHEFERNEVIYVCPICLENCGTLRVKLTSEFDGGRETKWLNITPRQFRLIEEVLLGDVK